MAEGLLSGILGEEDEKAEVETPDAMAGAESKKRRSSISDEEALMRPRVRRRQCSFLGKFAISFTRKRSVASSIHGRSLVTVRLISIPSAGRCARIASASANR